MSTNKCCGSCKHFKDENAEGFGFCIANKYVHHFTGGGLCVVHQFKDNGWTEITPENMDEIKKIDVGRLSFAYVNKNGYVIYRLRMSLEFMARNGGYYYYVLPELKID